MILLLLRHKLSLRGHLRVLHLLLTTSAHVVIHHVTAAMLVLCHVVDAMLVLWRHVVGHDRCLGRCVLLLLCVGALFDHVTRLLHVVLLWGWVLGRLLVERRGEICESRKI